MSPDSVLENNPKTAAAHRPPEVRRWAQLLRWMKEHYLVDAVTVLLAATAIIFAVIQLGDSRHQLRTLREQTDLLQSETTTIKNMTSSINTRYVGQFPKNLDDILPVVARVTDGGDLDIMTDHPGYAIYSRNQAFRSYTDAIRAAHSNRKVRVKMLVYDEDLARTALEIQFGDKDYAAEKEQNFRGFFEDRPPTPSNAKQFRERIIALQNELVHSLCEEGIQVRRVPAQKKFLFFLWLSSNPEAVFAFRNEAARDREISFRTLDPTLVEIFQTVFNQTWDDADPDKHALNKPEDPACNALHTSSQLARIK